MDNKRRSAILISALIILSFLSILGMGLISFLFSRSSYSQMQLDRLKAFYLAEAGIFKSIWELKSGLDPDGDGPGNIPRKRLGDGYFWVEHDFQTSTITSTAEVNRTRRKLQIKYSGI